MPEKTLIFENSQQIEESSTKMTQVTLYEKLNSPNIYNLEILGIS